MKLRLWWFLLVMSTNASRVGPFVSERQCIDYRGAVTTRRLGVQFDCWSDNTDPAMLRVLPPVNQPGEER